MFLAILLALTAAPVERPFASCAWVRAENDGAGGGFVVDASKRLLVTARHVVADRKKVDVCFPWQREGELVTDRAEYLRHRDALRERKLLVNGTVLKTSDEFDLVEKKRDEARAEELVKTAATSVQARDLAQTAAQQSAATLAHDQAELRKFART